MSALPSFRTERLALAPLGERDLAHCLAMDDDPEVMRFIPKRWHDHASHRAYVVARIASHDPAGMGYWAVRRKAAFLGWVLLVPLAGIGPEVKIGWRLVRRAWGHGYATEAARVVLEHALVTLALAEVVADADPGNLRSIRVMMKLGMARLGPAKHAGYDVVRFTARAQSLPDQERSPSDRGSVRRRADAHLA